MNKYQENLRERAIAIAKIELGDLERYSEENREELISNRMPLARYVLAKEANAYSFGFLDENGRGLIHNQTERGLIPPIDQPNSNNSLLK